MSFSLDRFNIRCHKNSEPYFNHKTIQDSNEALTLFKQLFKNCREYGFDEERLYKNEMQRKFIFPLYNFMKLTPTILTKEQATFIIEMFSFFYINFHSYESDIRSFLNFIQPIIPLKTLQKSPKFWINSKLPKKEYTDYIIDHSIPEDFYKKYEHPTTIRDIENIRFNTMLMGSKDKNSTIQSLTQSSLYDRNVLGIIAQMLD